MASAADHVDHVRTQLPYAILAGVVGMAAGDIPTAYGLSPAVSFALGVAALTGFLYVFGQRVDRPDPRSPSTAPDEVSS